MFMITEIELELPNNIMTFEEIGLNGAALIDNLKNYFIGYIPTLITALILLIIGLIANKIIMAVLGRGFKKSKIDVSNHTFFLSVIRIILYIVVFVTVLAVMGIPINSLIAVIGSAGLAIGLSMKDSLSNVAGGVMLLAGKPFKVGDYIEINGVSGTVTEISVIAIKLTSSDNTVVYLPNNTASSAVVKNFTGNPTRRIDLTFKISADANYKNAIAIINNAIDEHEKVLETPEPFVKMSAVSIKIIEISAFFWVETADYFTVKHDVLETVKVMFDKDKDKEKF